MKEFQQEVRISSYISRGKILYKNNGETPLWESAGMIDRGKLFAQLCMGFIEQAEIYVKNSAGGAAQENFGLTSIGSTSYPTETQATYNITGTTADFTGRVYGVAITPSVSCTITKVGIQVSTAAGSIRVAIYTDSGGTIPDVLLSESGIVTAVAGWNDLTLNTPVFLTAGIKYWLAFQVNNASLAAYADTLGGTTESSHKTYSWAAFPNPYGAETSYAYRVNMRITYVRIKGYIKATKVLTTKAYTVSSISFYSHATGNARLAIYDNASPKAKLWESGSVPLTAKAWKTVNISEGTPTSLELPAGTYWLCWQYDDVLLAPSYTAGSSGDGFYLAQAYGVYPATISGGTSSAEKWSEYGTGAALESLVLGFSDKIDGGEIFTKTVICPSDAVGAWRSINVREWWSYDKCFVYVKTCDADISVAYDAGKDYDEFVKGASKQALDRRLWIRLTMYGLAQGYLPVGGTVNTVSIPNTGVTKLQQTLNIPKGTTVWTSPIYGAGKIKWSMFYSAYFNNVQFRIEVDDTEVFPVLAGSYYNTYLGTAIAGGLCLNKYVATGNGEGTLTVNFDIDFQKQVRFGVTETTALTDAVALLWAILQKIA